MNDRINPGEPRELDEHSAEQAIRDAFPADAGLSSEKVRRMYAELRPVAVKTTRRRDSRFAIGVSVLASAAVIASVSFVYAALRPPTPPVSQGARTTAEEPRRKESTPRPKRYTYRAPEGASIVQVRALNAINPSNEVLHFRSSADSRWGRDAGLSTEEMWYDPGTGAGRMVTKHGLGDKATETIVVFDGRQGWTTTREPGKPDVIEKTDMSGRVGKSFDKLAAYRQMLESGTATVTAEGEKNGVRTYKLRAEIDDFGTGEVAILMEAEIRADNYLPISYMSGFLDSKGSVLPLKTRTFSEFETVSMDDLPKDWFAPFEQVGVEGLEPGAMVL